MTGGLLMATASSRPISITKESVFCEYKKPALTKEEKLAIFHEMRGCVKNVNMTLNEIRSDRLSRV